MRLNSRPKRQVSSWVNRQAVVAGRAVALPEAGKKEASPIFRRGFSFCGQSAATVLEFANDVAIVDDAQIKERLSVDIFAHEANCSISHGELSTAGVIR